MGNIVEQQLVARFNADYSVGTEVRYWKGVREGEGRVSKTRSSAQMLGKHTAVVWVEAEGACIGLSHVEPTKKASLSCAVGFSE